MQDLADIANFATYFTASPAALATPHLYISSLATWPKKSAVLKGWHKQFCLLPSFRQTEGSGIHTMPLMSIVMSSPVNCVAFSGNGIYIASGNL